MSQSSRARRNRERARNQPPPPRRVRAPTTKLQGRALVNLAHLGAQLPEAQGCPAGIVRVALAATARALERGELERWQRAPGLPNPRARQPMEAVTVPLDGTAMLDIHRLAEGIRDAEGERFLSNPAAVQLALEIAARITAAGVLDRYRPEPEPPLPEADPAVVWAFLDRIARGAAAR